MIRPKTEPPRGVLNARLSPGTPGYGRYWPSADLAPFVEHYWRVEWNLEDPIISEVLPHPSVQMVFEQSRSGVAGVHKGRFVRRLEGQGVVLGVKFRPGGFRPFLQAAVSTLTNRTLPLAEVFDSRVLGVEDEALAAVDPIAACAVVETFLGSLEPRVDPMIEILGAVTQRAAADRGIVRVEQLARESGIGARQLQRLFDEYVGVGPKWVIQRYRLHEAAERIASGQQTDWASFALELGYADQAHFIRDFKRLVGRTPAAYAEAFAGIRASDRTAKV